MKSNIKLKSKSDAIKWPRYEVQMDTGLARKAAGQGLVDEGKGTGFQITSTRTSARINETLANEFDSPPESGHSNT